MTRFDWRLDAFPFGFGCSVNVATSSDCLCCDTLDPRFMPLYTALLLVVPLHAGPAVDMSSPPRFNDIYDFTTLFSFTAKSRDERLTTLRITTVPIVTILLCLYLLMDAGYYCRLPLFL